MKYVCDYLARVANWGWGDMKMLDRYLTIANQLGIDFDRLLEAAEDLESDPKEFININLHFYVAISEIFHTVANRALEIADEETKEKIENMIENFSPFINYLDSWFNNELDEFEEEDFSDLDTAARKLVEMLR